MLTHPATAMAPTCDESVILAQQRTNRVLSHVPRLSWEGKETTVCACTNPYQQTCDMVSCFSLKKDIVIGWRWCLEDFNKVTRAYIDFWLFK